MGRKSIKENKTPYQVMRENAGFTREEAGEKMVFVSADRIEKIENERTDARPDEVLAMSKCYNSPELCNFYCTHECAIGKKYSTEVRIEQLSQIVLETLAGLDKLNAQKNRLVEITVDGQITSDEVEDFKRIQGNLDMLASAVESLKYWTEKAEKDMMK